MHITGIALQLLTLYNKQFFLDTISEITARRIRWRLRAHKAAVNCMTTYPNKILIAVAPKANKNFRLYSRLALPRVHPAVRRAHISTTVVGVLDHVSGLYRACTPGFHTVAKELTPRPMPPPCSSFALHEKC